MLFFPNPMKASQVCKMMDSLCLTPKNSLKPHFISLPLLCIKLKMLSLEVIFLWINVGKRIAFFTMEIYYKQVITM
jgi:hypothetical protein